MKNVFEHIEYVKGQPHHIRQRVALAATSVAGALIAVIWFAANSLTGGFAIQGSSFAMSTEGTGVATTSAHDSSALAGAAAALPDTSVSASAPAHIEIVDTTPAPAAAKKTDQTILPF